jgi:hypothetical protein
MQPHGPLRSPDSQLRLAAVEVAAVGAPSTTIPRLTVSATSITLTTSSDQTFQFSGHGGSMNPFPPSSEGRDSDPILPVTSDALPLAEQNPGAQRRTRIARPAREFSPGSLNRRLDLGAPTRNTRIPPMTDA